jgi:hypothetical protein
VASCLDRVSESLPLCVALAVIEIQHSALPRAVPIALGVVVLIAGSLQFTVAPLLLNPSAPVIDVEKSRAPTSDTFSASGEVRL